MIRLDKYLSRVRILKSRNIAQKAASGGMVFVNGVRAKPSTIVNEGDIIEVDIPRFYKKVKILQLPRKDMKKSHLRELYEILEERKKELL